MPKRQMVGSIIILAILSFICMYIYDNYRVEKKTTLIVETGNNNKTIVNYLNTKKSDYYLYNIDNIVVNYPDRKLDLSKALELQQITIDEVLTYLEETSPNDGKTVLYRNDDFSVLKCTLDNGNVNYIFGHKSMAYKESFCAEKPYLCTFTKSYLVLDISEGKENYDYLTLKNDASEEVATIQIDRNLITDLNVGNIYEFNFASFNDVVDGDIKSIFDNNQILDIKVVSEPEAIVNENICK